MGNQFENQSHGNADLQDLVTAVRNLICGEKWEGGMAQLFPSPVPLSLKLACPLGKGLAIIDQALYKDNASRDLQPMH